MSKTEEKKQKREQIRDAMSEGLDAVEALLNAADKGSTPREKVEAWDKVWESKTIMRNAVGAARRMLDQIPDPSISEKDVEKSIDTTETIIDAAKKWMEAMREDKAPTFEQRVLATLDRIEERQATMIERLDRIEKNIGEDY